MAGSFSPSTGERRKLPDKQTLAVPSRALAEVLAEEWQSQGGEIDPSTMPITRIVNSAIDGVAPRQAEVVDDLVRYAGSDLVYYPGRRAGASRACPGRRLEPGSRLGEGCSRRPLRLGRRRDARGAAGGGDRGYPPGHRADRIALRPRCSPRHDDPVRLGADRARPCGAAAGCRAGAGQSPMWTSFIRRASGARITRPWSAAGRREAEFKAASRVFRLDCGMKKAAGATWPGGFYRKRDAVRRAGS